MHGYRIVTVAVLTVPPYMSWPVCKIKGTCTVQLSDKEEHENVDD